MSSNRPDQSESLPCGHIRLAAFALALVTLLIYLPAAFHDFIIFDDPDYVSENPMVQAGLTWAGFKWAFMGWHADNWHPLTWLSHELDCQLFGPAPGPLHLVNVLFHVANAVLLFWLWHRLTGTFWPAFLVAAFFAWHPLRVESVAWIAERKDVLSTFFMLLTLLAYAKYAEAWRGERVKGTRHGGGARQKFYGLALLFFLLALLAKPMAVTLPFVLLLLDWWPLQRFKVSTVQRLLVEKTPFFLLTLGSCLATLGAQRAHALMSLQHESFGCRIENALAAYGGYVWLTFYPHDLAVFYPLQITITATTLLFASLLLLVMSGMTWRGVRQYPFLVVGWLWFIGTLVPVIGLVQVGGQAMADRYTYWPSVGLSILLVHGITEIRWRLKLSHAITTAIAVLILTITVVLTEWQLTFWRNTQTLFTHTLAVTQQNGFAHMLLGIAQQKAGNVTEAEQQFQMALRCDTAVVGKRPLAGSVESLLAQTAEANGETNKALEHYQLALAYNPDSQQVHNNYGNLLDAVGQPAAALLEYQTAVQLRPDLPLLHDNLGTQLDHMGHFDEALREYALASQLDPNSARPDYLRGKALYRHGQTAEAIDSLRTALQHQPDDVQTLIFLARILATDENPRFRNGNESVTLAEKAGSLVSDPPPPLLAVLAMAYAEAGRFDEAQQTLSVALTPANTPAAIVILWQKQLQVYASHRPWRDVLTNELSTGLAPAASVHTTP